MNSFLLDKEHEYIFKSRQQLQLQILKELSQIKSFGNYISYILNPIKYIEKWVTDRLTFYYSNEETLERIYMRDIHSKIRTTIDQLLTISKQISHSNGYKNSENITTDIERKDLWENWKQKFHEQILNLVDHVRGIKISDFLYLDLYVIYNYSHFSESLKIYLNGKLDNFDWKAWSIISINNQDIPRYITNKLIECKALCPFCQEPCQMTGLNHREHYCGSFHRPKGIGGGFHRDSKSYSIADCNTSLTLNKKFIFKGKAYPYDQYRTVNAEFARWKILPTDAADSKY